MFNFDSFKVKTKVFLMTVPPVVPRPMRAPVVAVLMMINYK